MASYESNYIQFNSTDIFSRSYYLQNAVLVSVEDTLMRGRATVGSLNSFTQAVINVSL